MTLSLLYANDRAGRYPGSWYAATADIPDASPPLAGEKSADVCIIGGGYTGLSAALHLAQAGYRTVVLEAHRCGWGASGRNGGQAGSGQRVDQHTLEQTVGREHAHRLWAMAEEAKALVRSLIAEHGIDCLPVDGIIHAVHKPRQFADLRAYAERLQTEYGYDKGRVLETEELRSLVASENYHGGVYDSGAFHLHPLRFALGLAGAARAAGAEIHETSEVTAIDHGLRPTVRTAVGSVRAEHVVIACNGYLGELDAGQARCVMPINNFIIATEPLGEDGARAIIANGAAVSDSRFVVNYFRMTHDHRLLFGGGETYGYRFPQDIKAFVRRPMLKIFPQLRDARIDFGWGGTLAITMSRMPALARNGNILSAAGYSGHGVTTAIFAGRLIADAIRGRTEKFDLFASLPVPDFPGGRRLRSPLLALAMTWYALRDRI